MSTIVAARATAGSRKKHRGNSSEGPRSRRPVLFRTQSGRGSLPGIVVPRRWRQSEDVRRLREPDELGRVSGDDASRGGPAEHSRGVSVAGGVVHSVGTLAALAAGSVLLASTLFEVRSAEAVAAAICVGTLLAVLTVSLAFNMWQCRLPSNCVPGSIRLPSSCSSLAPTRRSWSSRRAHRQAPSCWLCMVSPIFLPTRPAHGAMDQANGSVRSCIRPAARPPPSWARHIP